MFRVKSKELRKDKKFVKLVDRSRLGFDAREIESERTRNVTETKRKKSRTANEKSVE